MRWLRYLPSTKRIRDAAASKAAQAAAAKVVERFGPHRYLSKLGALLILVGILLMLISCFFFSGWSFGIATACSTMLIGFGCALRGFNNLLISLFSRLLTSGWRRICAYTKVKMAQFRTRNGEKQSDIE